MNADRSDDGTPAFEPGTAVSHAALGAGTVVETSGSGRDLKIVVDFEKIGRKTVLAKWLARG